MRPEIRCKDQRLGRFLVVHRPPSGRVYSASAMKCHYILHGYHTESESQTDRQGAREREREIDKAVLHLSLSLIQQPVNQMLPLPHTIPRVQHLINAFPTRLRLETQLTVSKAPG